jgi:hypothetical protein
VILNVEEMPANSLLNKGANYLDLLLNRGLLLTKDVAEKPLIK